MSIADFDSLTPGEFDAIYTAFGRTRIQEPWEQVRFVATACLSPWSKKSLKPQDVVRFAWDGERLKAARRQTDGGQTVTREEARKRFERLTGNQQKQEYDDSNRNSIGGSDSSSVGRGVLPPQGERSADLKKRDESGKIMR